MQTQRRDSTTKSSCRTGREGERTIMRWKMKCGRACRSCLETKQKNPGLNASNAPLINERPDPKHRHSAERSGKTKIKCEIYGCANQFHLKT